MVIFNPFHLQSILQHGTKRCFIVRNVDEAKFIANKLKNGKIRVVKLTKWIL